MLTKLTVPATVKQAVRESGEKLSDMLDGGIEPRDIKATSDPNRMVFASYLNLFRGFNTIEVTNPNPASFSASVPTLAQRPRLRISERFFEQKYELDILTASSVVVTSDMEYAFVLDWHHPVIIQRDIDQLIRDNLRELGAKIGIIRKPFGNAEYLGATSPIPLGFGEELELSSDGKKLYANYRGAGDVLVFDVDKMIAKAEAASNSGDILTRRPLDHPDVPGPVINLPGIAVGGLPRGLSVQKNDPLTLVSPQGTFGGVGNEIAFNWEVETDLIPQGEYRARLFVSTQPEGQGLWPEDPERARNEFSLPFLPDFDSEPTYTGDDKNPNRIHTGDWIPSGSATSGDGFDGFIDNVAADVSKLLTAGNRYFWGVELEIDGAKFKKSTSFVAKPVETQTVTVLTHGFQFGFSADDSPLQQPQPFLDMGKLIIDAAGGDGVVASYNKNNGAWVVGSTQQDVVSAINEGKSVVLVSDWVKESDISDSGFSEAAADALFTSMTDLDRKTGGKLFNSHLHFVGHSRGTVVNSEIIQRVGRWFPSVDGIHMTTLDPHDFEQKSLDIPVAEKLNGLKDILEKGALAASAAAVVIPPAAPALLAAGRGMTAAANVIERGLTLADTLGIAVDPIPYADFQDPDVTVWNNVGFADNYYQTQADASEGTVTLTPNGRSIAGVNLDVSLDGRAGFTQDDNFLGLLGLGGAHSRVWQWYAGTIDVNIQDFAGNPIFRDIMDEGISSRALSIPLFDFNQVPFYAAVPGASPNSTPNPNDPNAIWEGIGNGWYLSELGGGVDNRPGGISTTNVTEDNSEVPAPKEPVPTVFNGDFENGTRQSILNWFDGTDKGRFPLSYEVPGWSFHGGRGFELAPAAANLLNQAGATNGPLLDVAGLFVVNPTDSIKTFVKDLWDKAADKLIDFAKNKNSPAPDAPDDDSTQDYRDWYEENWGDDTPNRKRKERADKLFDLIDGKLNELAQAGLDFFDLEQAVQIGDDPNNPLGFAGLKSYIGEAIDAGVDALLPGVSHSFIMGAGEILRSVVGSFIPQPLEMLSDAVLDAVAQLDSITHNRLYVPPELPLLSFDAFAPYMYTEGAAVEVTMEAEGLQPFTETIPLNPGFFSNHTYSACIPDEYRGRMATFTLSHKNMEDTSHVSFNPLDLVPGVLDNPLNTASQLFFMDNVRFEQLYEDMVTVTPSEIDETGTVTLEVTLDPQLSDRANSVRIDFGEGDLMIIDLPQGELSTTVQHTYNDDNPTGTPSDIYDVVVTVNGSACQTYVKKVTVNNVKPTITIDNVSSGNQSVAEIDEGDTITVEYTVSEIATEDELQVEIEWEFDVTETITLDMEGETERTFTVEHTYLDDNPTATPTDMHVVSFTIMDDDTGSNEATFDLTVHNLEPEFTVTPLTPLEIDEGETVEFEISVTDIGIEDTHELEVDWDGDGPEEPELFGFSVGEDGTEVFVITHEYLDDDPTATPSDTHLVTFDLVDDDFGIEIDPLHDEHEVTVNNVEPTLTVTPTTDLTIDENNEISFELTIEDPGIKDSFKVTVTWEPDEEEIFEIPADDSDTHTLTVSRVYKDDNPTATPTDTHNVTFVVEDDDTGLTDDDADVTINNVDPEVEPISDKTIPLNEPLPLTAEWEDEGEEDTHTHEWEFTHQMTGTSFMVTGESVSPSFDRLGFWDASYTITDDDTGTVQIPFLVNVDDCFTDDFIVTQEIDETGTIFVSITADEDRVDGTNGTVLWGDGTSDNFTLAAGGSVTVSKQVDDDDPTGTPSDPFDIEVTVGGGCNAFEPSPTIRNVAPEITLVSAPTSVNEGQTATVTINVNETSPLDTHIAELIWGDGLIDRVPLNMGGAASRDFTFTHVYKDETHSPGGVAVGGGGSISIPTTSIPHSSTFAASAKVEDDDTGSDLVSFDIEVFNLPPTLTVTPLSPLAINEQESVSLQLSINDPGEFDTHRVFIDWDGPGGAAPEVRNVGPGPSVLTVSHKYEDDVPSISAVDFYNVRIAVQDDNGGLASAAVQVSVANVAPVVTINSVSNTQIDEGQAVTLNVTVSEVSPLDTLRGVIEWAPGITETVAIDLAGGTSRSFTFSRVIPDDNPSGTPFDETTIQLTVRDDDSGQGIDTQIVRVDNVAPSITVNPQDTSLVEGDDLVLDIEFVDPGIADRFDVSIDWGNGQTSTINVPANGTTSHTVPASQIYRDDNPSGTKSDNYVVNVRVEDDDTGADTDSFGITVTNAPPQVGAIGNRNVRIGELVDFAGVFADIGIEDTHTHLWTFSHPTGTSFTRTDQAISVTFDIVGTWTGTYRVTDDDTDFDSKTFAVNVSNPSGGGGGTALREGDEVSIGLSAGPVVPTRMYRVDIDWGDGRTDTYTRSGADVSAIYRHNLADDIPTATLVDTNQIVGRITDTATGTQVVERIKPYTVNNVSPEITAINTDGTVTIGSPETLTVDFNDPGVDDTHTFTWNFGDGSAPSMTTTPSVQHTFGAGSFNVQVTIEDDDTGQDTFATTISTVASALPANLLTGDINEDGEVAFDDFLVLSSNYGKQGSNLPSDLSKDGIVGFADFLMLAANFGSTNSTMEVLPVAQTGITNGTFDIVDGTDPDFGWSFVGPTQIDAGRGVLGEQGSFNARMSQHFVVPEGTTGLSFTVLSTSLGQTALNPADVFEVALLDAKTFESAVGMATGLTLTDAALNLQHDGTAFFAPTVSGAGLGVSGQPIDLSVAANYTIGMTGVAAASELVLYFDVLGFGDDDSQVVIDDVILLKGPQPPILSLSLTSESDSATKGDQLTNINPVDFIGLTNPNQQVLLDTDGDGFDDGSVTADDTGSFTFTDITLAAGLNSVQVQATNEVGTSTAATNVSVDDRAPIAELLVPATNVVEELPGYVSLRWTDAGLATFDANSVSTDDLIIAGVTVDRVEGLDDGTYRYWYNDDGETLASGDNQVEVVAGATSDSAGNLSSEQVFEFTIRDVVAPAITAQLAPESDSATIGDDLTNLTPVAIVGTTNPLQEVTLNGERSVVANEQGDYRFEDVDLLPGANNFTLSASTASETLTVTLDNQAPLIELVSPAPGTSTTLDTGYITLRISDPGAAELADTLPEPAQIKLSGVEVNRVEQRENGLYRYYYDDQSLIAGSIELNVTREQRVIPPATSPANTRLSLLSLSSKMARFSMVPCPICNSPIRRKISTPQHVMTVWWLKTLKTIRSTSASK